MVQLQDSHKWPTWDDHQKNGVEEIFDQKYPDFKDGSMTHDVKAKCANGDAKFRTQLNAAKDKQLCQSRFAGATLAGAWEWKGKLCDNLVKLKVGARGVDCHVDGGRRNLFSDSIATNLWYGFNIPNGPHAMDAWQWSWRGGVIYSGAWRGWNFVGVSDCRGGPNATKTGPGNLGWTDRWCMSKDEHEVHSNVNVDTTTAGGFASDYNVAYQYKGGDWMSYVRGAFNIAAGSIPSVHWGASYRAHKTYANVAYRLAYSHADKSATHSVGFEGKCYSDEVYYKAHVDVNHSTDNAEDRAHTAKFNLFQEHKVNSNFSYKYKVSVDLMNPQDYRWGAVFTQNA